MQIKELIDNQLDELTGYKQDPYYQKAVEIFKDYRITVNEKLKQFNDYMQSNGFHVLGSGISGMAFEKPNYPWIFKIFTDDDGYLFYFNYARANQNNPHVPKVKGGTIKITPNTFLVRVEKLTNLSPAMHRSELVELITSIDWPDDYTKELRNIFVKNYPHVVPVLDAIISSGYSLDLHMGNLMTRGNTLVITDPLLG